MLTSTQKKIVLEWETCSRWNDSHMNDLYTKTVNLKTDDIDYEFEVEFFVSGCRLIFKTVFIYHGERQTSYYDMGSFVDSHIRNEGCKNVKQYAQYVIDGYAETFSLVHCPSFEYIDGVDERFNPITDEAMVYFG